MCKAEHKELRLQERRDINHVRKKNCVWGGGGSDEWVGWRAPSVTACVGG